MGLSQRVWDFCARQDLLTPGEVVVVAVSGGPDSLCLLDVLHGLAAAHRLHLTVAHLNHGLRAAAAEEAEFVRAEAAAFGLPCVVDEVDTRATAHAEGLGLEAAARRLRYDFLTRVAQAVSAARIAVAHTADDQAETVLMHLLRGSGLAGLRGMAANVEMGDLRLERRPEAMERGATEAPHRRPLFIVRPLLATVRAEVEAYCAERGLKPRRDDTNRDTQYLRNWVRHIALPLLETRNPNLRATLARTAEVLAGEHALAQATVEAAWVRAAPAHLQQPGQVVFDRSAWRALDLPLRRGLLRRGVAVLRGAMRDVDFAPLDAVARFSWDAAAGRSCEAPGGLRLTILPEQVVLAKDHAAAPPPGPQLDPAGNLMNGWQLEIERLGPSRWAWADVEAAGPWEVYVDAARVSGPLETRQRRVGERFHPLGLAGHRVKVSDYMVNAKVPRAWRAGWPVVACGNEVVWLAGLRLDERFRVQPDTEVVLRLTYVRDAVDRP